MYFSLRQVFAFFAMLVMVTACGSQPANYTSGNTSGSATSGSSSDDSTDGATNSSTVQAITFNNSVPVSIRKSRSFKVIMAQDFSIQGATLKANNFSVEINNNDYDQLFDIQ